MLANGQSGQEPGSTVARPPQTGAAAAGQATASPSAPDKPATPATPAPARPAETRKPDTAPVAAARPAETADTPAAFREALVSPATEEAVGSSVNRLKEALRGREAAQVEAVLRPMLKEWLDANLPGMVERVVREEIARIAGEPEKRD